jgi:hypothetical protein
MKKQYFLLTLAWLLFAVSGCKDDYRSVVLFEGAEPVYQVGTCDNLVSSLAFFLSETEGETVLGIDGGDGAYTLTNEHESVASVTFAGDSNGYRRISIQPLASGDSKGLLLSGVTNLTKGQSIGVAISGVANVSDSHNGLQLSTINFVKNNLYGSQIGVVNYAKKGKGIQIGVVNVCGADDDVLPIGLFNVVKNGYYAFEVSTNELFITSLSYKMGKEKFHTIFRAGIGEHNDKSVLSTGLGFGSIIPIKDNHKLNMELICDALHYNRKWGDNKMNLLNQFNLNYQYQVTKHLGIKVGPSFKTFVTNQKENGEFASVIKMPHTLFEHSGSKYKVFAQQLCNTSENRTGEIRRLIQSNKAS